MPYNILMTHKDLMSCYIDNSGLFRQSEENSKRISQKILSYKQLTPSKDLTTDEYRMYLENASPGELDLDIISKETYDKISLEGFYLL